MLASELIEELQSQIEEHGDLPVYSVCDYAWVRGVVHQIPRWLSTVERFVLVEAAEVAEEEHDGRLAAVREQARWDYNWRAGGRPQ